MVKTNRNKNPTITFSFLFPVGSLFQGQNNSKERVCVTGERSADNHTATQLFVWHHMSLTLNCMRKCEVLVQTHYWSVSCHHFLTALLRHSHFPSGSNPAGPLTCCMYELLRIENIHFKKSCWNDSYPQGFDINSIMKLPDLSYFWNNSKKQVCKHQAGPTGANRQWKKYFILCYGTFQYIFHEIAVET